MRRDIDRSVTSGAPDCAPLRCDLHRIAQRDPAGRYGRAVGKVSGWSDPDTFNTRYNFACALSVHLMDKQAGLDMLETASAMASEAFLPYVKADQGLELLLDVQRYQAMVAADKAHLADRTGAAGLLMCRGCGT